MSEPPFTEANWRLPEGHESVGAFATKMEAQAEGQRLVQAGCAPYVLYLSDKRGAWEVIRFVPTAPQP